MDAISHVIMDDDITVTVDENVEPVVDLTENSKENIQELSKEKPTLDEDNSDARENIVAEEEEKSFSVTVDVEKVYKKTVEGENIDKHEETQQDKKNDVEEIFVSYPCSSCDLTFKESSMLKLHEEEKHSAFWQLLAFNVSVFYRKRLLG